MTLGGGGDGDGGSGRGGGGGGVGGGGDGPAVGVRTWYIPLGMTVGIHVWPVEVESETRA